MISSIHLKSLNLVSINMSMRVVMGSLVVSRLLQLLVAMSLAKAQQI